MAEREHRLPIAPLEEGEAVLHPLVAGQSLQRGELERLRELLGGEVGRADGADRPAADELVERAERLLLRDVGIEVVGHVERDALDTESPRLVSTWRRIRAAPRPWSAPSAIGLNVLVASTMRSRTSGDFVRSHPPMYSSLRRAPVGVGGVERRDAQVPRSVEQSEASSRKVPLPKGDGDEPIPPKLPQPRMMRDTAMPLRASARCSTARSYAASATCRPDRSPSRTANTGEVDDAKLRSAGREARLEAAPFASRS